MSVEEFMLDGNDDDNDGYGDGVGVIGGCRLLPTAGGFFAFLLIAWRLWRRGPFSFPDAAVAVVVTFVVIIDATVVIQYIFVVGR